jgi:phosphoribosylaminoimidazole-succinocarboxamide synthase
MLCRRAEMLPVECVARGYLAGSGWKEYQRLGAGLRHPAAAGAAGVRRAARADLHPRDEGDDGHDENISFDAGREIVGDDGRAAAHAHARAVPRARDHARERGILLADTKFEFGLVDGELTCATRC